jgi:hypothetical protein
MVNIVLMILRPVIDLDDEVEVVSHGFSVSAGHLAIWRSFRVQEECASCNIL